MKSKWKLTSDLCFWLLQRKGKRGSGGSKWRPEAKANKNTKRTGNRGRGRGTKCEKQMLLYYSKKLRINQEVFVKKLQLRI
jgi:hypothetical protein